MTLGELFHNPGSGPITNRHLAEFLLQLERNLLTQLQDLQAAVTAEDAVIASAITLINGIAARITAAGTDGDALAALSADIQAQSTNLAAAVAANTPAAPTPPAPSPAPAPAPVDSSGAGSAPSA